MPTMSGEAEAEVELKPNVDAILEDLRLIGEGLVTQVKRNR